MNLCLIGAEGGRHEDTRPHHVQGQTNAHTGIYTRHHSDGPSVFQQGKTCVGFMWNSERRLWMFVSQVPLLRTKAFSHLKI